MERRIGLRARTDFAVRTTNGWFQRDARAIEISGTGLVVAGPSASVDDSCVFVRLELSLPERVRPIFALARPVRRYGVQEALRFIEISDVDRLTLAEHLDILHHGGAALN